MWCSNNSEDMDSTPVDRNGRTIKSVNIAFNIIEELQNRNRAGVTELADELEHSKSTIHSHLRTLEDRDILVSEDGGYRLSVRLLELANHVRDQFGNYDVITNQIESLADETGEIANYGIREHDRVAYLYKAKGSRAVESASSAGTKQPIYSTSLGKAILAYLPDEKQAEIIEGIDLERRTPDTITSAEDLHEELEATADRGYSIDNEENVVGLRCVAAPVREGDKVLGSVSLAGPSSRITHDRIHDEFSDYVKRAANVIELNTKFA